MDANIEDDNEDEQQTEQERITAAAAARRKRLELISVLQRFDEIPSPSKNKTDELVDHFLVELGDDNNNHTDEQLAATTEQDQHAAAAAARRAKRRRLISVLVEFDEIPSRSRNKTNGLVDHFLTELGDDVHMMLCAKKSHPDFDNHRGLDSDRDTEAEVEAIIRFFPHALSRNTYGDRDISWCCHIKAVPFIPFLVRLAIQLGLFEEQYRGGLLCEDIYADNVLKRLMHNCDPKHPDADDKCLQVLLKLRGMGLLKKEDIQSYALLNELCGQYYFFAEKRLRFLVEWDPNALLHPTETGWLPIHSAAWRPSSSTQRFQLVFEYGIRYFPKKKGLSLLFKKNDYDNTPFQFACIKFGDEKVMEVVEDTLAHWYASSDNTPPLDIEEALLSAAINENIHLDCVYFLLRRQPDMLQKLLLSASMTTIAEPNKNIDHDDGDDRNDGVSNNHLLVTGTIKKRKRE